MEYSPQEVATESTVAKGVVSHPIDSRMCSPYCAWIGKFNVDSTGRDYCILFHAHPLPGMAMVLPTRTRAQKINEYGFIQRLPQCLALFKDVEQ